MKVKVFRYIVVVGGILLAAGTALMGLVGGGFSIGAAPILTVFALWSSFPYVIYGILGSKIHAAGPVLGAGLSILAVDIFAHIEIFYSTSSTAPIAFIFMPLYLTVLILPLGLAAGWLIEWSARKLFC